MTWIKLDDGFPQNPKIVGLSDRAFRDYISGLCYSGMYPTDGFIPKAIISKVKGTKELINSGLWEQLSDGILIINYTEYQSQKSEVERKKELNRDRVMRYREKSNALVMHPENREQRTEINTATPNGVQGLVALYFDNFKGEIKPSGAQLAGHIQLLLKQVSIERLTELVPLVALEGKPLTVNTVAYYTNREKPATPTPTPPRYSASDAPVGVPIPAEVKSLRDRLKYGSEAIL